jgi:hypothetical protein
VAPLICPSPNIIDQTFPRSVDELRLISRALGRIAQGIAEGEFVLVLTEPLRAFIGQADYFDWSKISEFPQLQIIYYTLAQFGLQLSGVESIDVSGVSGHQPHPVPRGCTEGNLVGDWSDETGRLYALHEGCRPANAQPFIAVACTSAFAGEALGGYENPGNVPHFVLIGPDGIEHLLDAEEWDVSDDVARQSVSFDDAKNKIRLLGGTVTKPKGSSHYQVRFMNARTWPLDFNYPDVPEAYLKELIPITGFELRVIKYVLLNGKWPKRRKRLHI